MQQCEPEIESLEEVMVSSKNHIPAGDKEVETYEEMIKRASRHVDCARAQCLLYKSLVLKARQDVKNNVTHSDQNYTVVVDYGQNMDIPFMVQCNQVICIITLL